MEPFGDASPPRNRGAGDTASQAGRVYWYTAATMAAEEHEHLLTIVIPALNEQEAIGDTIRRCLEAREHIIEKSPVAAVEVIVVSDGSTDRTEEIARSFEEVTVLGFEENRGYGAAIQCGFAHGSGDLVSFLDADGTCDPRFFADLCRALDEEQADLALGSRMGADSEMPVVRRIGNTVFAWILGALSHQNVRDTASGMRVIRRSALPHLYPLPDGLHFTPAMSARVLLEERLKLIELPMAYAERTGRSKLSVLKDGMRFLRCIIEAAVAFQPARPLLYVAGAVGLVAVAVGIQPVIHWLQLREIQEPMIYRILLASLLTTVMAIVLCTAVVADHIAATAHYRPGATSGAVAWLRRLFSPRGRLIAGSIFLGVAVGVVWPGIVQFASSGQVDMHWSRAAFASLLVVLAAIVGVTTFLLNMLGLIRAQRENQPRVRAPERIHSARNASR